MGIKEGKWKCSYCGGVNLGRDVKCVQCGQPRGKDVKFFLDDDAQDVADQGLVDMARGGADWTCAFCGTNNRGMETRCRQCAAERGTSPSLQEKMVAVDAPAGGPVGSPAAAPAPARRRRPILAGGIAAVILAAAALLVYFLFFSTSEKTAVLDRGEWQRTVRIVDFKWVTHTEWEDRVPAGAVVLRSWQEKYGTEKIQTGTERRKTGTVDKGNGFFEDVYSDVPVYTERDVYKNKVEYRIQEWVETRTPTTHGDLSTPPVWPQVTLVGREREKMRSETAAVYFALEGRSYKYEVPVDQLGTYAAGSRYRIWLTPLGAVKKIEKL